VEASHKLLVRQEASEDVVDREALPAERRRESEPGVKPELNRTLTDEAFAAKNRVIPTAHDGANCQCSEGGRRSPMVPG
jgi:hypothetical protein